MLVSRLGVIIDLGGNFLVHLYWIGVLFLNLCFLSGLLVGVAYG